MRKRLSVVVLGAALTALSATFAHGAGAYGGGRCEQAATDRLEQLNVDMADVRKIVYAVQRGSGETHQVIGIDAWVNFHSRRGSLVIDMSPQCRVRQVYTRGEYRVLGVPNY